MEDTVTIPVREHERLLSLEGIVADLQAQLDWCKRQIFGQKSERLIDAGAESPLLPWDEELPTLPEPEKIIVPTHTRRKKPDEGKGSCTLELPDDMPSEVVWRDIPEADKIDPITGEARVLSGIDEVIKLAERRQFIKKIFQYPKYAQPGRPDLGVIQAPAPPCIIKGSKFDASFMAYLAHAKYVLHLPLFRIEENLANQGIRTTRQTLSSLLVALGIAVAPLLELMSRRLLAQGVLFTDDTHLKLLNPGAGKTHQAQIWTYVGGGANAPPYHIYHFTMDRSHKHPLKFLENFVGLFHGDAFEAHVKLDQREDVTWAACWAHARRYFENAQSGDAAFRAWVLRMMRYLFMFERIAWTRSPLERLAIRQKHERPLVDQIFKTVEAKVLSGELLPRSSLGKAANYLLRYKQNFRNYLYYPDLRMDNNVSERSLRKLVLGRKNWLYVGSPRAGHAAAALLSLVQTCRAMDINVRAYLEDLFTRWSQVDNIEEFLPERWQAAHPDA